MIDSFLVNFPINAKDEFKEWKNKQDRYIG